MIHCHRSHHRLDLHHTACIHIKFLDMSIGRLLSWSYSAEEFGGVISKDWRCQCVLLDAGICSSQSYCFSVLNFKTFNFFRVFSTVSSEKWWSFDCRRSFFAYLMSRAFDLLIEDGISRDFDDDLADISTVLFNSKAAWDKTMFVAWSRIEMDAMEEEISQESCKCASCEDIIFSYSSKDPCIHIIFSLEWSSLGATILLEVSGLTCM